MRLANYRCIVCNTTSVYAGKCHYCRKPFVLNPLLQGTQDGDKTLKDKSIDGERYWISNICETMSQSGQVGIKGKPTLECPTCTSRYNDGVEKCSLCDIELRKISHFPICDICGNEVLDIANERICAKCSEPTFQVTPAFARNYLLMEGKTVRRRHYDWTRTEEAAIEDFIVGAFMNMGAINLTVEELRGGKQIPIAIIEKMGDEILLYAIDTYSHTHLKWTSGKIVKQDPSHRGCKFK
ncbi:MAG: hypothetical protein COV07_02805 [Candidatus Vogelbacteria bacterium CG10_big_fil_rev_8_21_14_0_10_45_14]|uniref:Uncharacterized protein n=1 Tax=Candidatus Vogelbacteria bacterium CG10_big_fil_rev_8_21_14_0_10_45_14 TaxID=1975042 RepID=A0A2H0RJP7_9BACT|nr:MAG: hypothetical protein COV07_02805 [Candidatus Vogelbacteria bacterium CG10_big_fil_rev_8_21_14_0_10_45_14]